MADEISTLYFYDPSLAAGTLFTILYGITAISHTHLHTTHPFLLRRKRTNTTPLPRRSPHRHTIPTAMAAVFSTAGYALRCASVQSPASISLYATSSSLIVIAPIFVCASLYLLLARLIMRCLPSAEGTQQQTFLHISPLWLGRLFITSDVLSFMTQGAGTSIAAGGDWVGDEARIGTNVLLTGLALQLATFTVFIVVALMFVSRVGRTGHSSLEPSVRALILGAAIASVFVQIRSVYRVVEFALGIEGYLFQNEWCLYVLEAVPMLVAVASLAWWHPARLLPEGVVKRESGKEQGNLEAGVSRG